MTPPTPTEALQLAGLSSPAEAKVQRRLHRGRTGECWLVAYRQQRYVLRVDAARAANYGHDRSAELQIARVAAEAGVAPAVIGASPGHGVLLTQYIDGRVWTPKDMRDEARLGPLAATLRGLHALRPAVRRFDLAAAADRYAADIGGQQATAIANEIGRLLQCAQSHAPVLCHNDLVATNIVEDQKLWLIDWEFAGLGNPYFDLAVVACHHDLTDESRLFLLRAYWQREDAGAPVQLELWCEIYRHLLALWQRLALVHGSGDHH